MGTPSLLNDKKLYSQLCNLVNGALASCVKDHGEVVIGSASKRIVGQLLGALQEGNLLTQSMQNAMSRDLGKMKSEHMAKLAALEADARRKEEALRELVSLKDLKDSLIADYVVNDHPVYSGVDELQYAEYELRKPLAWAAARAALSQEPGGK